MFAYHYEVENSGGEARQQKKNDGLEGITLRKLKGVSGYNVFQREHAKQCMGIDWFAVLIFLVLICI